MSDRSRSGVWAALPWPLRYGTLVSASALVIAAFVWLLLKLAVLVAPLTLSIIVALILTTLFHPVTEFVARWLPRGVAALAGLLVLLVVLVVPGWLMWQTTVSQFGELSDQLDQGLDRTRTWLVEAFGVSGEQIDGVVQRVTRELSSSTPDVVASAGTAAEALGSALLAVILFFFFLKDGPAMARWLIRLLPDRSQERWATATAQGWHALARYARGTVAVAAIDAAGIGLALILLGVPLALPLILLTFLAAFVPVLGATVAGALAVLVALAAKGPTTALIVLAAVIAVQQIEGNLLEPLIMGRALRLHPAVVLIAVTAGTLTGGIAGAIVSVPLTAVTYKIARSLADHPAPHDGTDQDAPPPASAPTPRPGPADHDRPGPAPA